MDACIRSRVNTAYHSRRNQAYETTYSRSFSAKRPTRIVEGAPLSQRFPISCPFNLSDPVGETIYTMDFSRKPKDEPKPSLYQSTSAFEPVPTFVRRSASFNDNVSDEIKQALRNQLDSTYQVDFTGELSHRVSHVLTRLFFRIMPRLSAPAGIHSRAALLAPSSPLHHQQ